MTQDEIIEMARQAGFLYGKMGPSAMPFVTAIGHTFIVELEAFAKLVDAKATAKEREVFAVHAVDIARRAIAEEREACAKVAEDKGLAWKSRKDINPDNAKKAYMASQFISQAIRARGETTSKGEAQGSDK